MCDFVFSTVYMALEASKHCLDSKYFFGVSGDEPFYFFLSKIVVSFLWPYWQCFLLLRYPMPKRQAMVNLGDGHGHGHSTEIE